MDKNVQDWWRQAEADLDTAIFNLNGKKYYASVIFAQQAAEKALKALFFVNKAATPPKIHDLVELCNLVNAPDEIKKEAADLSQTYLMSRYPGAASEIPVKFYTKEKAARFLHEAEVIVAWVKKQI